MRAFINYGILLVVGGVLTTSTSPLPMPESLPVPTTATSRSAPDKSAKVVGPNDPVRAYHSGTSPAVSAGRPFRTMSPNMTIIPPCQLLDRFENGRVYDAYGRPAGSPPSTIAVTAGRGGLTYVGSIQPSVVPRAFELRPPAAK